MDPYDPYAALAEALKEAEALCPPGTRGRNVSHPADDFTLRFALITEYEPELAFGRAPVLRSEGSHVSTQPFTADGIRRAVMRIVERHNDEWAFIHGPEVAAAAEKWKAAA